MCQVHHSIVYQLAKHLHPIIGTQSVRHLFKMNVWPSRECIDCGRLVWIRCMNIAWLIPICDRCFSKYYEKSGRRRPKLDTYEWVEFDENNTLPRWFRKGLVIFNHDTCVISKPPTYISPDTRIPRHWPLHFITGPSWPSTYHQHCRCNR